MSTLILYFSRSNKTKKVAETIADKLNCDIEQIYDNVNWTGPINFIKGGFESASKKSTKIKKLKHSLNDYDNIIIGSPVWASNMPPAIRTLNKKLQKDNIKNISVFITCAKNSYEDYIDKFKNELNNVKNITGFSKKEIDKISLSKIKDFIEKI